MEISEMIKAARVKKGMTQQEVRIPCMLPGRTISKWELGKNTRSSVHRCFCCASAWRLILERKMY